MPSLFPFFLIAAGACLAALNGHAEGLRVSGTVTDATGAPVEGVPLWISQFRSVQQTQSAKDGTYSFEGMDVGPAELVAFREGAAITGRNIYFIGDAVADLVLREATIETVQIFDTKGQPVPGAQLKAFQINDSFSVPAIDLAEQGFPRFRSDDNGIIVFRGLPVSGYVKLVVSHRDFVDSGSNVLPIGQEKIRSVILEEGIKVRGLVEFEGNALPDAQVSIFVSSANGQHEICDLLTDSSGFFVARLLPGDYQVAVRHGDYASPPPEPLHVESAAETPLHRYAVQTPRFIEGAVQYPDGAPCPGVGVRYSLGDVIYAQTLTAMNGEFRLQVASTKGLIHVSPPRGYQTKLIFDLVDLGDDVQVKMPPIQLEALPHIQGQILNEAGEGMADVLVQTRNLPSPIYAITDESGRFSVALNYMPDTPVIEFRAEHAFTFYRSDFELNWTEAPEISVQLKPFSPSQEQRSAVPGNNDLDFLVNEPAPEWEIAKWFAQHPVTLKECRGKVVVLLFWGGFDERNSWLALEELKALQALYRKTKDVYILAIHDSVSTVLEVEDFITYYQLTFDVGVDADPQVSFTRYSANFIPLTVLIDKDGVLRYYQTGGRLLELIKVLRRKG